VHGISQYQELIDFELRSLKRTERLIEAINMAATVERLLDALEGFSHQGWARELIVLACHPQRAPEQARTT